MIRPAALALHPPTSDRVGVGRERTIDEDARFGLHWQSKNRPTFNDDEIACECR